MSKPPRSPVQPPPGGESIVVPLDRIELSPLNPRTEFPPAGIRDLAATIERDGLLQPLTVRPAPDRPGHFEIAAGERRFRALQRLQEQGTIPTDWPVPVQVRELDDQELLTLALVENLLREDLHPLDEAFAYKRLVEAGVKTAEIARRVRRTQRHVQFRLTLTGLHPKVQKAFRAGELTVRQARALATVPPERHLPAFEALRKWPSMYQEAAHLMGLLTKDTFPRDRAAFSPEEYTGPTLEDPESGKVYYADLPQVLRLQRCAAERIGNELLENKKLREVEVLEGEASQLWTRYRSASGQPTHGVVLLTPDGVLSVFDRLQPLSAGSPSVAEQTGPTSPFDAPAEVSVETEAPIPRTLLAEAQCIRNSALQAALADRPEIAARLMLVGLLQEPGSYAAGLALAPSKPAPPVAGGSAAVTAAWSELAEAVGEELLPAPGEGHSSPDQIARLFDALLSLPDEVVRRLLTPLVAARVGSPAFHPGDAPLARRLAAELAISVPAGAWLSREYLGLYRKAHLIHLAVASGAASETEASSLAELNREQIIEKILTSESRDPAYVPDELGFEKPEKA